VHCIRGFFGFRGIGLMVVMQRVLQVFDSAASTNGSAAVSSTSGRSSASACASSCWLRQAARPGAYLILGEARTIMSGDFHGFRDFEVVLRFITL